MSTNSLQVTMLPTKGVPDAELALRLVLDALRKEARRIAVAAAEEVLARRPVPTAVTLKQAAEMLEISPRTAQKLKLPRNAAGLIPYEVVLAARATR